AWEGPLERPEPEQDQMGGIEPRVRHRFREDLKAAVALEAAVVQDHWSADRDPRRRTKEVGAGRAGRLPRRRIADDRRGRGAVALPETIRDRVVHGDHRVDL